MPDNKLKKHSRRVCPKCSIKFQKSRLICPFCRTLMSGSLPIIVSFAVGGAAILFAAAILSSN